MEGRHLRYDPAVEAGGARDPRAGAERLAPRGVAVVGDAAAWRPVVAPVRAVDGDRLARVDARQTESRPHYTAFPA